jgi:hypothetical protein
MTATRALSLPKCALKGRFEQRPLSPTIINTTLMFEGLKSVL